MKIFGKNKKKDPKTSNSRSLHVFVGIFSFFMFVSVIGAIFSNFDNNWLNFRLNLPHNFGFFYDKYINKPADERISIAAIDENTTKKYGWPFKRRHYAALFDRLNALGAKVIAVDVLFFEPDRDAPENDAKLVEGTKRAKNVVHLLEVNTDTKRISAPIKGLIGASRYLAYPNSDIGLDSDGYVRKFFLFYPSWIQDNISYGAIASAGLQCAVKEGCLNTRLAALGMAAYAIFMDKPLSEYERLWALQMNSLTGPEDLPAPMRPLYINFRYPQERDAHPGWGKKAEAQKIFSTYRHISVADVIEGKLSDEEKKAIKGGILLVGSTALGTYDHFPSPFNKLYPGVEVHANVIDNLLHGDDLTVISVDDTNWFTIIIALLVVLLAWLPVYLYRYSSKVIVLVSAAVVAVLYVMDTVFYAHLYSMPFITCLIAYSVPFIYVIAYKALMEGREKKWIKNTFGQYLSPKVVEVITKDPTKLTLGGEKREMTVFFLDIAGFTAMSEKMTPEQLTTLLNKYMSGLTDVILKYDGVVDKFIGDCIMAFWNAPLDQKDHRKLACLAAVECTHELKRLNDELTGYDVKPSFRIGLNSGPMIVGNMGSNTRFSYTVLGDSVNLASRLEGANKFFHSKIMISEATYEGAGDSVEARCLGRIRVVGKAIPVKVFELMAHKGKLSETASKMIEAYNAGLAHFEKGEYEKAKKDFKAAIKAEPNDGPSAFYLELAEKYSASAPKDWDGTFNLTSK